MNFNIHANGLLRSLHFARYLGRSRFKVFLAMRLTAILLFCCFFHVSANVFSQEVTLSEKNAPLEKVMQKIRKQTGYAFIFDVTYLKKAQPVNVDLKKKNLAESLWIIFENQPFNYEIKGKTIVLSPKPVTPVKVNAELKSTLRINGKVVDEQGNAISGASVKLKGGNLTVITDGEGRFSIDVPDNTVMLIVSYLVWAL